MKQCPFCTEEIHEQAVVCVHCGKALSLKKKTTETRVGLILSFILLFLATLSLFAGGILISYKSQIIMSVILFLGEIPVLIVSLKRPYIKNDITFFNCFFSLLIIIFITLVWWGS